MFRELGLVIYNIQEKFIHLNYLCLNQDNLSKNAKKFSNTRFDDFTEIGIPDVLMNIMSWRGFSRGK